MDTHDEEFGRLIRKQIAADKLAKEKRDITHAQGERPSKPQAPPSLGLTVPELLFEAGKQWQATEDLLRETVLRAQLCLPTSEQELRWFNRDENSIKEPAVIDAMKAYAANALREAAERAKVKSRLKGCLHDVDKQSILSIIDELK